MSADLIQFVSRKKVPLNYNVTFQGTTVTILKAALEFARDGTNAPRVLTPSGMLRFHSKLFKSFLNRFKEFPFTSPLTLSTISLNSPTNLRRTVSRLSLLHGNASIIPHLFSSTLKLRMMVNDQLSIPMWLPPRSDLWVQYSTQF
jgi:hypothetical protein